MIELDYRNPSVTNLDEIQALMTMTPIAHRVAQDVLVAAQKVIRKEGLFSTERSRVTALVKALANLNSALDQEGYLYTGSNPNGGASGKHRMFAFFNRFARGYPNWQAEYAILNRVIPNLFDDENEYQESRSSPAGKGDDAVPGARRSAATASPDKPITKVIILCPKCHSQMRIPVGIKIRVTCQGCGNQFVQEVKQ